MRGKGSRCAISLASPRITPAYAGKSCDHREVGQGFQDHPRLCGEKMLQSNSVSPFSGSPPPMRGKVSNDESFPNRQRITPAYAGKRVPCKKKRKCVQDHPRLCGEKGRVAAGVVAVSGSPPPMRGKVTVQSDAVNHGGITPAYAGKSQFAQSHSHGSLGSPPPMRGKVVLSAAFAAGVGITPAYAGKSEPCL